MAVLTVRKVPDEVHRALRTRAAKHGRRIEAGVRSILEDVLLGVSGLRVGDELTALGWELELTDDDIDTVLVLHDRKPAQPVALE